jgi:predicted TIM-barrel fold metal-dependent hydrolase
VLPPAPAAAQAGPRRIDVHHHVFPPALVRKTLADSQSDQGSDIVTGWSPARAIEQMEKNGIAAGMASLGNPGAFKDRAEERAAARAGNEYMAGLMRDHPGRFGMLANLPLSDVEASLAEIAYAYDTLRADGIGLYTSYGDKWPGDPIFAPVFEELNRRKAVVFIHPTTAGCCTNLQPGIGATVAEYMFDVTRCILSLVLNGTTHRNPDIRFIFTHAGAGTLVLAERFEQQMRHPDVAKRIPDGVNAELRKLYYDVANSTISKPAMLALMTDVPSGQILFGSDYPYVAIGKTAAALDRFGLTRELQAAFNRGNAARLFPRFA